jgi:hypothetical protein
MRVNNRIAGVENHEAPSCSCTLAKVGPNRVGEHQLTPNCSRASRGGPSQGGASSGGDGGSSGSSSHGVGRRGGSGSDRGG